MSIRFVISLQMLRCPCSWWQVRPLYRYSATLLGASMWFFVGHLDAPLLVMLTAAQLMYRAKKDGPALLGWKHPWDHWVDTDEPPSRFESDRRFAWIFCRAGNILSSGEGNWFFISNINSQLWGWGDTCFDKSITYHWHLCTARRCMWMPFMASGKDNGKPPKFARPHTQKARRKPCRIFAIYKTTWRCCPCHMSSLNAAKLNPCLHSCSPASPVVQNQH